MKAIVLAAGKGTRLLPLTEEVPKPMAPVVGEPIIQHIFELLAGAGTGEVHVNVHHLSDAVLGYYGEETRVNGMPICFSREDELMGTAGGVKRLADRFDDGAFVVIMGDALTDVDLREVVAFHREQEALATLALMPVADTTEYGVVGLDPGNNIVSFQEKPDPRWAVSNLANTGIYVLEPRVLEYVPEDRFFDFSGDVFPKLLEAGEKFVGYKGRFYWSDIGNLEAYRAAQRDVLSGRVGVRIPGERREENLWIDGTARLHSTVTYEGPVVVGRDAVIERGAILTGDVTLGRGCRVWSEAMVKRSILLPGSSVGKGAYVDGCIVGPGCHIRAGERILGGTLIGNDAAQRADLCTASPAEHHHHDGGSRRLSLPQPSVSTRKLSPHGGI